jgi:hypothetical protein
MAWTVVYHPAFLRELSALDRDVADKLREMALALAENGPQLGRPLVDSLHGSRHANMKELRLATKGAWRFAFAFDPARSAVILVGGNKEGGSSRRFYKRLIQTADKRFDDWLHMLADEERNNG